MEAKFKDLKFKSKVEMNEWLKKVTHKVIDLKDNGQDMQRIWVHETGEILNCDFHSSIYCGKFIDMKKLVVGNHLNIWDDEKKRYKIYQGLFIEALS
jgi:hypothetical protein